MTSRRHRIHIYRSVWHLVVTFFFIVAPFVFLWAFSDVAHIPTGRMFTELGVSMARLGFSYIVAAVLAWICGVAFYQGKASAIALPLFDVLQSFPTFAALPLATYLWGRSDATVIIFLVITIIWPIFFSIVSNLRLMKNDWEESAEIVELRGFDYLRYFLLPASIPGLITGSIIGLGEGWEALVATEMIVQSRLGLGNFFQTFSQNAPVTAFGIFGLLFIIFSVNKLVWIPLLDWSHLKMEE